MTNTFRALITLSSATLLYLGCDQSGEPARAVASLNAQGAPTLLVSDSKAYELIKEVAPRIHAGLEIASFKSQPSVKLIGNDYFLVAKGIQSSGECATVAVLLEDNSDGYLGGLDEEGNWGNFGEIGGHTCTGVRCSSCDLTIGPIGENGAYHYYCNCLMPAPGEGESYCNHTYTQD